MSFMEHAFNEMKAIDPSITSDQFSRNWLNKCSSYYRSYKATNRDLTVHALMCLLHNLSTKSSALRMNNDDPFLHQKAKQYELIKLKTNKQIRKLISNH
jgi:hypothetical protein